MGGNVFLVSEISGVISAVFGVAGAVLGIGLTVTAVYLVIKFFRSLASPDPKFANNVLVGGAEKVKNITTNSVTISKNVAGVFSKKNTDKE